MPDPVVYCDSLAHRGKRIPASDGKFIRGVPVCYGCYSGIRRHPFPSGCHKVLDDAHPDDSWVAGFNREQGGRA